MAKNFFSMRPSYIIAGLAVVILITVLFFIRPNYTNQPERDGPITELLADARSWMRTDAARRKSHKAADREAEHDSIFAGVLSRNPGIEPVWKSVPDDENGFLQWKIFKERVFSEMAADGGQLTFKKELDDILSDEKEWNLEDAAALMLKYADLLDEMTAIGQLKDSSSAGVLVGGHFEYQSMTKFLSCMDFLLAGARYAAESGDSNLAIVRLNAALGISRHHYSVEGISTMDATEGVVCRMNTLNAKMQYLLPSMELDQKALSELRASFRPPIYDPSMKAMIRGEFMTSVRDLIIPLVTRNHSVGVDDEVKDLDALHDALAQAYLTVIRNTEDLSVLEILNLVAEEGSLFPSFDENLSENAKEVYEAFKIDYKGYYHGFIRSHAIYNQHDAVMAILASEDIPVEPITGKPYVFDEDSRTLSLPEDELLDRFEIELIKLP